MDHMWQGKLSTAGLFVKLRGTWRTQNMWHLRWLIDWIRTRRWLEINEFMNCNLFTMLLGSSQNEVTRRSGGKPLSYIWSSINLSIYPSMASERGRPGIQVFQIHLLLEHLVLLGPRAHLKRPDEQNILAANVLLSFMCILHHMVLRCMIYDNPLYVHHNSINIWI